MEINAWSWDSQVLFQFSKIQLASVVQLNSSDKVQLKAIIFTPFLGTVSDILDEKSRYIRNKFDDGHFDDRQNRFYFDGSRWRLQAFHFNTSTTKLLRKLHQLGTRLVEPSRQIQNIIDKRILKKKIRHFLLAIGV